MSENDQPESMPAPVGNFAEIEEPGRVTELIEEAIDEEAATEESGLTIYDLNINGLARISNDWSLIVADRDLEVEFRSWGTIEVPADHTAVFANEQLMAIIGSESGTSVQLDGFEERLIKILELEIEYLVSQGGEP